MSVTYTAFGNNQLINIYKLPKVGSFDIYTLVLKQASSTQLVYETVFQTATIRTETTGVFSVIPVLGSTARDLVNGSANPLISSDSVYVNGAMIESYRYANPISLKDLINSESDATSSLKKKIYSGDDVFVGSALSSGDSLDDAVAGYDGNDVFYGYGGDKGDLFDGGNGIDISVYRGALANYTLTKNQSFYNISTNRNDLVGTQIVDKTKLDGTDGLVNVERLQFTDTMLALDIGSNQTAGSGYMLYKAAFNRTPDAGGLGYWISKMDTGMSYSSVAQNFVNSAEFKTAFGGANPSVNTLVTKLYNNVLNRTPDAGGLAFWQNKLSNEGWTTADVLGFFSTSGENVTNVTPLIANGIQYQQFVG
jgi:hypothetical protein